MTEQQILGSMALLVREDQKVLLVKHERGPFAGEWTMPLILVPDSLTAEESLEKLLTDSLSITPGPYEFHDTIYVTGHANERVVVNIFTCIDWVGEPRVVSDVYVDAGWSSPNAIPDDIILNDSVQRWLSEAGVSDTNQQVRSLSKDDICVQLTESRGNLLAAFDQIPARYRLDSLNLKKMSALEILALATEFEDYFVCSIMKINTEVNFKWEPFNVQQWRRTRELLINTESRDTESSVRELLSSVAISTDSWIDVQDEHVLLSWGNDVSNLPISVFDQLMKVIRNYEISLDQLTELGSEIKIAERALRG
jgi:ADP-ribose pyrophosphatase YjhB (NUDIX family)|tara:strand:+ start:3587 stop:4516 length:930 start_codon:yes stop_codon:yes gene_type:complete